MLTFLPIIFVVGYILIALEHPVRTNKAATALMTGFIIWILLALWNGEHTIAELHEHTGGISEILLFLVGAMIIVQTVDEHGSLAFITNALGTTNRPKLYAVVGLLTFFLSAVLDNMTTAIVMSAILSKMLKDKEDVWKFAGLVIIAANAGGAWSPIGDVTTIMLWIGGQVTSGNIISRLFLPSLISLAVPLIWLMVKDSKTIELVGMTNENKTGKTSGVTKTESLIVLVIGLGALFLVPIIKYFTHLPPYISIMGGLGLLWMVTEFIHLRHPHAHERHEFVVSSLMKKIDMPSVLFFLGILLAVAGLETSGHLRKLAELLDTHVGNVYAVNSIIGLLSSIVDNVPLVAGAMGMYPLTVYAQDHVFWELLAFCAGTGGSILIIGSAAGVATMGILKIEFVWYMKKISLLALSGYVAGIITFWLLN